MELSEKQIKKYKGMSVPQLLKLATDHFNRYIRQRDSDGNIFRCISCGKIKPVAQMDAGHFMAASLYTAIRFDENNVHGQCVHCNRHMDGNLSTYRDNLVRKIGQEEVDRLMAVCRNTTKLDRGWLIEIIFRFKPNADDQP
ncbi:recombination protein NinG [Chitinophaga oryzae]|uniref:Recombination protein NinG n=1 Tax=Chitinophaga oryzae TaxID=2725414 RepID=A0ABX6LHZ8_9BACT|nr:recombination protein NinG [Chitinophaga oryzae]QJB39746.1 recombination protein NinG [Chitinophaga oryzae]